MSEHPRIKFTEVWDKLKPANFKPGSRFSTYRRATHEKMAYYRASIGKVFDVDIWGEVIGTALLDGIGNPILPELVPIEVIKSDTHPSWGMEEWLTLLRGFYGPDAQVFPLYFVVQTVSFGDAKWF